MPFLHQIEELKDKEYMSHPGAVKLNQEIAELLEQNHALATLRAKECIDSAFFISQTNELEQKISALRAELQRYRDINDYQELLDGTRTILDVLNQAALDEFQPAVFKKMISRIIAGSQALRFQLINGLELVEPIERWPV